MSRERGAIRSGGIVVVNHVAGAVITVLSALLLSKALGPQEFGIYALCVSLSGVLRIVGRLGVHESLVTRKEEPTAENYGTALTAMLLSSGVVAAVAFVALPAIGHFSHVAGFRWPGFVTVLSLPLAVIPIPALSRLERGLRFRPIMIIEFVSQVIGQVFGITLAFGGWGVWGPVTGGVIRAAILAVGPWVVLRLWPRLHWNAGDAWQMIRFGFGYVIATSFVQARSFGLLAVVGRVVSQEAVGYMGLILRGVGLVAPFRAAVSRVILPTIAPMIDVPDRLRRGINAVVETELLLTIPVTVLAVWVYGAVAHFLLGATWYPTVALFPWVAAGSILTAAHAAALSALHAGGFFAESVASSLVSYAAIACAVVFLSSFGPEGAAAATVAMWPASWIHEWLAHRRLGTRWSRNGVGWAIAGAAGCLAWRAGPIVLILPLALLVATRGAIRARSESLIAALRRTPSAAAVETLT